jgi:hypothetical protein
MGPAVARLAHKVRRLTRLALALQELAVDVSEELTVIRRTLNADASGRLQSVVECALLQAANTRRLEVLRAAAAGARTMELRALGNGSAMVRIDEGRWFHLSRADSRLLRVVATAMPDTVDGFPAWQTYEQVTIQVARMGAAPPTRRAITESVYRIRQALKAADLNPHLLKVEGRSGRMRFLLRGVANHVRTPGEEAHVLRPTR